VQRPSGIASDTARRPQSLQRRVVQRLILPVAGLFVLFMAALLYQQSELHLVERREEVVALAREQAFSFGLMLKAATSPTARTAQLAALLPELPTAEYWQWFQGLLDESPALYGTGVTFWPGNRAGQRKDLYVLRGVDGNFHDGRYAYQDESFTYDGADGTHEWFSVPQKSGKPQWSPPYFDEGSGNVWMVTYSIPFYLSGSGAFDGVAFSDIRIDTLREQMSMSGNFKDGDFFIFSREGQYIYHADAALIGKPLAAWQPMRPLVDWLSAPVGASDDPPRRIAAWPGRGPVWAARHAVAETGWVIVSIQPDESLWRGLLPSDLAAMALLLLLLVVVFLVALRLTARLTGSIGKMTAAAEAVARGDWDIQLPETGANELARLAHSLNSMARQLSSREATLQRQRQDLIDFNRDLEARVLQRTAELDAARAEAERANAAKSRFLANISHELRTPMNAIIGFTHLASTLSAERFREKGLDYFRKIGLAAATLRELIDDLLDFTKIDAGGLQLESRPFVLAGVIDQVVSLTGDTARQKGLRLKVRLAPEVPRQLQGDSLRLGQVLTNLVSNAIKFTSVGEVELAIAVAAKPAPAGSIRLCFSVRDTGIGIESQVLPQLFQAFVQADPSTTRRYGGTGLGLAICRELVELMNGRITVESQLGVGSTFRFDACFGCLEATTAPADVGALPPSTLQGRRVLLAEDNEINREIASVMLQQLGLAVTAVENGAAALDALQRMRFDLVLMDLQMPVMDGLSATRRIRADARWAGLPVIAMTANAMAEDQEACREAGMNDHIAKPVDPATLQQKLAQYLGT